MAQESRTEHHNGRREIDSLCREVCDGSLKSEQSRWNRGDLKKHSVESLTIEYNDAHCLPSMTLSSNRKVLGPVQSFRRRFRNRLRGIAPGCDKNDAAVPLFH